jgi:hypothetical protein
LIIRQGQEQERRLRLYGQKFRIVVLTKFGREKTLFSRITSAVSAGKNKKLYLPPPLPDSIMVVRQILDLDVEVRALVGQHTLIIKMPCNQRITGHFNLAQFVK